MGMPVGLNSATVYFSFLRKTGNSLVRADAYGDRVVRVSGLTKYSKYSTSVQHHHA
jgi:hypothetical protein